MTPSGDGGIVNILATDRRALSYKGKLMEYMPGTLLTISADDADTLAQEEIEKQDITEKFTFETSSWSDYVFDDGTPVTAEDVVAFASVPGDTTFTFVQEPAIYRK